MIKSTTSRKLAGPASTAVAGCVILFGLPFLLAGLAIFAYDVFLTFGSLRARTWVKTPCTVQSAKLETFSDSDGDASRAKADYTWEWDGKSYRSSRVTFSPVFDNLGTFQAGSVRELKAVAGIPDGFHCWVNPANPAEAVLYRDVRWVVALFHIPFIMLFPTAGAGIILATMHRRRRFLEDVQAREENPNDPSRWRKDWAKDYVEDHHPANSRVLRLLSIWWMVALGFSFARLFLTDEWETARVVCAIALGAAILLVLIYWIRRTSSFRRYAPLSFIPDSLPLTPGERLSGTIPLRKPLLRATAAKARIQVRDRSGDSSKTIGKAIADAAVHPHGVVIEATLPECPQSSPPEPRQKIVWQLLVKFPGESLQAAFDLPVFGSRIEEPRYSTTDADLRGSVT